MQKIIKTSLFFPFLFLSLCFSATNSLAAPQKLPISVQKALSKNKISSKQLAVSVRPLDGGKLSLNWQADKKVLPASTEKIITTLAALETLGPNWRWKTEYLSQNALDKGTLNGPLYIRGGGDPTYVIENLWRDLSTLKNKGLEKIKGDIVIDRSYFSTDKSSVSFGSDIQRPYMKEADAALLNYQAVTFDIEPDPEKGIARVTTTPPLKGLTAPATVKLTNTPKQCIAWRQALDLNLDNEWNPIFKGGFPQSCPPKSFLILSMTPRNIGKHS